MLTLLAVIARILVNPLANVFQKRICSKGQSPLVVNLSTYAVLSLATIPFGLHADWSNYSGSLWGYAALVGLFGALGNGLLVQAVRSGELSVLGPINAWKSVVGIVFGIILLYEIPSWQGICGVGLIVYGSYFVLDTPANRLGGVIWQRTELRDRVGAMVLAAIEAVFIKKVIQYSDPNVAMVLWCWGGTLFSAMFLPLLEKVDWPKEFRIMRINTVSFLGLFLFVGLMQWTTNLVFEQLPVGFALALFQLSALVSVLYGYFFFHESQIPRKLLGAAIMVVGSGLIVLS